MINVNDVETAASAVPAGRSPPAWSTSIMRSPHLDQMKKGYQQDFVDSPLYLSRYNAPLYALSCDSRVAASSYKTSPWGLRGLALRPNIASTTSLKMVCRFSATTFTHASLPIMGK